jgi:type II secretory pathway pseudopilin PulG
LSSQKGITLVEVLVTAVIISIVLLGIIGMLTNINKSTNNSFCRGIASVYAGSLMEQVLSYPYEDSDYRNGSDLADAVTLYASHDFSAYSSADYRDNAASGIWDDALTSCTKILDEPSLSFRGFRSSVWDSVSNPPAAPENTAFNPSNPFPLGANLDFFTNYLGIEAGDIPTVNSGITGLQFYITESNYDNYYDAPRIFYADDIDDFDGTRIVIHDVLADMNFTITVAVRGKFCDSSGSFSYPEDVGTYSMNIGYLEDMGEISFSRIKSDFPSLSDNEAKEMARSYYQKIHFKEVVVTVSWEYPAGSGKWYYYSVYGGKDSPYDEGG